MTKKIQRILLVDDDPNTSYILGMMLKLNDFEVYAFTNPEAALKAFKKDMVDLLLLDIRMPGINGFELYKKMKHVDRNVKVCFMTNYNTEYLEQLQAEFPELADKNFWTKPASTTDLAKMMETILGSAD